MWARKSIIHIYFTKTRQFLCKFFIVFFCSILSLIYGGYTINKILQASDGSEKMKEIAVAIQEGAQAYLNRQYITISLVGVLIAILLFYMIDYQF